MRILGVDPGSRNTGYGVLDYRGRRFELVASGCIAVGDGEMSQRLVGIFEQLSQICEMHRPDVVAIESVFVKRNIQSAIKLGQARGAVICAVARHGLEVSEYAPATVKQSIAGGGRADKAQVAYMVQRIVSGSGPLQEDEADALAIAICHAHHAPPARMRAGG